MKITGLSLRNVGVWKQSDLEFDRPLVLVLGGNGTGKTTLATAIELVLTGRASRFEGYRLGLGALVGPADEAAFVDGRVDLGGRTVTVERRVDRKGLTTTVNGKAATKEVYDFISPAAMRDPAAAWRTVAHVGDLLDQGAAGQKQALLGLIDPSVPEAEAARLQEPLARFKLTAPIRLEEVPTLYALVYARRREAKAKREEQRVPEAPQQAEVDVTGIEDKLRELRGEERERLKAQGQAAGRRAAVAAQRATLEERVNRLRVTADELGSRSAAEQRLKDARTALEQTAALVLEHRKEDEAIARLEADRATLRTQAKALGGLGKACVISGDIECPLKPDKRKAADDLWRKRIDQLTADITTRSKKNEKPSTERQEAAAREAEEVLRQISRTAQDLAAARGELADLDQQLATLPADAPTTSTADDPLAVVQARIRTGEANLSEARRINAAWSVRRDLVASDAKLKEDVEALEFLCAQLGPKGLGERLLGERLGAVQRRLNETLRHFGLEVRFEAEPWAILFNGRSTLLLSGSERFRASVALQVAVAEVTGARWLMLDGADVLDAENRATMGTILLQAIAENRLDQALVLATPADASAVKALPEPIRVLHLTGPGHATMA